MTDVPVKESRPSRHGYGVSPSEEHTASWQLGVLEGILREQQGTRTWTVEITVDDNPISRVIHERNIFDSRDGAAARLFLLHLKGQE